MLRMRTISVLSFLLPILISSMTAKQTSPAALTALAPTGTLRVGINFGNALLTSKDPKTGVEGGIAVDLAKELSRRLGVPMSIVPYASAGAMADGAKTGAWDV